MTRFCNPDVARAVKYEIDMFQFLCEALGEDVVGSGWDVSCDALLESLLLHVRVLRDFFYCQRRGRNDDDVLASDFIDDWNETEGEYLKTLRDPLNKLLAHLTLGRAAYATDSYLWDPAKLRNALDPTIKKFLHNLPEPRKSWFD